MNAEKLAAALEAEAYRADSFDPEVPVISLAYAQHFFAAWNRRSQDAQAGHLAIEQILMIGRRAMDKCHGTDAQHIYIAREVERAHGIGEKP